MKEYIFQYHCFDIQEAIYFNCRVFFLVHPVVKAKAFNGVYYYTVDTVVSSRP